MANLSGYKSFPINRWGSLIEDGDPNAVPLAAACVARNVKYTRTGLRTRDGVQQVLQSKNQNQPESIAYVEYILNAVRAPKFLLFDRGGVLEMEDTANPGTTVLIANASQVDLPTGADMQTTYAYNRAWLAFSDLKNQKGRPTVFNGVDNSIVPLSYRLIGEPWTAAEVYKVGEIITPTVANGHWYICTQGGTSGAAQPVFPVGVGATVADNTVVWTENTPVAADSAASGNLCAGVHYFSVTYVTVTGYRVGLHNNAVLNYTAAGGKKVDLSKLPIGGDNILYRLVTFTLAGSAPAGPYFYIPEDDVLPSPVVNITKTLVLDNVATTAEFDFTDDYLEQSLEATNFFRLVRIPPCVDICFIESLGMMVYSGCQGLESSHYFSQGTDPESVFADSGQVDVAMQNGFKAICVREFRGRYYSIKEQGGYLIEPAAADPSKWAVTQQWADYGILGPRGVDVSNFFMLGAGRKGIWFFTGDYPLHLSSPDIERTWKKINWAYGHKIAVKIDQENLEAKISVPLGDATDNSHTITIAFLDGWDSPILKPASFRRELQVAAGRRFSIDDIAATQWLRINRPLASPNPNESIDNAIATSQLVYASSSADGSVDMVMPGVHNDNDQGIDSVYETGAAQAAGMELQLGGLQVGARGMGEMKCALIPKNGVVRELRPIQLTDVNGNPTGDDYQRASTGTSPTWRVRFTNGKVKDSWFELRYAALRANPVYNGGAR